MPFVILDRDGVINFDSNEYIKSPDEWHAIPGSLEAIAQLNRAGYRILIVTNQSGVARGYYDIETLDQIHEKMVHELASVGGFVEEIFFCPHHPEEYCHCRKPMPGLFHDILEKYSIDFTQTYFIGDSATDIQVAQKVGCLPLLVLTGKGQLTLEKHPEFETTIPYFADLASAVEFIVTRAKALES